MGTPRTRPSKEDRDYLGRWVLAVGETTVPLLAGFSFTSAIIVSDDAVNFRWPGPAIVTLGFASVVLIASVQSAYIVRLKLLSGAETPQADVGDAVSSQADQGGVKWARGMRRAYHCGIVALLAGLGLAIAPLHDNGIEDGLRWFASSIAFAGCAAEAAVILNHWLIRPRKRKPPKPDGLARPSSDGEDVPFG